MPVAARFEYVPYFFPWPGGTCLSYQTLRLYVVSSVVSVYAHIRPNILTHTAGTDT